MPSEISESSDAVLAREFFDVVMGDDTAAEKTSKCDIIAEIIRKRYPGVSVSEYSSTNPRKEGDPPETYEPMVEAGTLPAVEAAWGSESRVKVLLVDQFTSCRAILGRGNVDGSSDFKICPLHCVDCSRSTHKGKNVKRLNLITGKYCFCVTAPSPHGPHVFSKPRLE